MNKQILIPGILALTMSLLGMSACADSPTEHRQEANEAVKDAGKDLNAATENAVKALQAERDDMAATLKQQSLELDNEITELDRKIEKAAAKDKARWQDRRKRLTGYRDELNADLKRVGADMKDGWTDFKNTTAAKMEKIAADLKQE